MPEVAAFEELRALCERVHDMIRKHGAVYRLRNEPAQLAGRIKRVKAYCDQDEAAAAIVRAAIAGIADDEMRRSEKESAAALNALAVEIEMIRSALPSIAARAAIELGAVARNMKGPQNDL